MQQKIFNMRNLNSYIVEKLVINDKVGTKFKYVIYYKKSTDEPYRDYEIIDKLDDLKQLRNDVLYQKHYRVFKCPDGTIDTFLDKWEHFNPLPMGNEEGLWEYVERVHIKELKANDINDYFFKHKKENS